MDYGKVVKDRVSAIICTYKHGNLLFETIDSILAQDYAHIEIIVHDDATPDFDFEKVKKYIQDKNRGNIDNVVVYSYEGNVGTVKNANGALEKATGEYIKFIAGDDCYADSYIFSKQVEYLKQHNEKKAVIGKVQQCDASMRPVGEDRIIRSNAAIPIVLDMEYDAARKYIFDNDIFPIGPQTTCFRYEYFIKNGCFDEKYRIVEDASFQIKMLRNTKEIGYQDMICVYHRKGTGVSSQGGLISAKMRDYYYDCMIFDRDEIAANPVIYGKHRSKRRYRRTLFFYKMAQAKCDKKNRICQVGICIKFLDVIFEYIFSHPGRFFKKVKESVFK